MITIYFANNGKPRYWNVNQSTPLPHFAALDVTHIRASDLELETVKFMFSTHPTPNIPRGKDVYIYGDLARTIVANLARS